MAESKKKTTSRPGKKTTKATTKKAPAKAAASKTRAAKKPAKPAAKAAAAPTSKATPQAAASAKPGVIQVKLVRSLIGSTPHQRAVVAGLGLRKLNHTVERKDTREIRGMVAKVPHLVNIVG